MNIRIICVGKLKETYLKDACSEYIKRLSKYAKVQIIELEDEKLGTNLSISNEEIIKEKECNKIIDELNKISKQYVAVLDLKGVQLSSLDFAQKIQNINVEGYSNISFVIGGSLGISDNLLKLANLKLSMSKMTFPHQLFRVFLLEQIFRAFKINNNETYHH